MFIIRYFLNATKKAITLKSGDKEKVETNGDSVIAKRYGKTKVTIQSQDPGHKSTEFYVIVKRPLWHYLVVAGIGVLLMVGMVELLKKNEKEIECKGEQISELFFFFV